MASFCSSGVSEIDFSESSQCRWSIEFNTKTANGIG
jgi:hypothetical protein